jgi:DNA primase
MPVISPATIQRVRAANDIVDVIGGYIPLKKAGASFVALCPFHKEKSPSFHVNPQRQIFHCFGCNKGGDVFSFVREYESLDFVEAVRRLAERARIELDYEQGSADAPARHIKEQLFEIHEQIAQRWQTALANDAAGQIARDYLAKRGVSAEAMQLFRLGYAPDSWDDTVNWAASRKYETAIVEQAGLIIRRDGGGHYDRFRGRLMFPICDEQGRVVGFSGRILAGDEKTAKYVNSPETPIFTKSKIFFGLDKSKRALLDEGRAIVCEGQLDLIACFMGGVKNIVAPQGTAFTADHARIIKRYVNEVVLCFDSDAAGQNAAVRSLDHLLAAEIAVRVAVVPEPHDPDSFIKEKGGAEFKRLLDKAEGFFDFYLGRLCAQNNVSTDRGRLAVLQSMADALHKADNQVLLDTYARKTALRLGVLPDAVLREFSKRAGRTWTRQAEPAESAEAPANEAPAAAPSTHEHWLLKILVNEPEIFSELARFLDPAWIQHGGVRDIVQKRLEILHNGEWQGLPSFMDSLSSDEQRRMISEAGVLAKPLPNPEVQLKDIFVKLRNQAIDRQLNAVKQRASFPETPEEERVELLRELVELRQSRGAPLAELR